MPAEIYPTLEVLFGVVLCCVLITAVVGNTLTFLVVTRMNSWNSSAIMFIAHLGLVDILNSLLVTPFSAVALFTGRMDTIYRQKDYETKSSPSYELYQWLCDINGFMFIVVRVLVPLTNLNIAIDRTVAVILPLKYTTIMNTTSVVVILLFDWLIALIFGSATIFINRHVANSDTAATEFFIYNEYTTLCDVQLGVELHFNNFITSLSVSTVVVPFLAVFILSMVVIRILVKKNVSKLGGKLDKAASRPCALETGKEKRSKRTRKATHTLLIVVFLYMALWLPYVTLWIFDVTRFMLKVSETLQLHLVTIATLCIALNSATNPLIFITRSEKYRSVIYRSATDLKKKVLTVNCTNMLRSSGYTPVTMVTRTPSLLRIIKCLLCCYNRETLSNDLQLSSRHDCYVKEPEAEAEKTETFL